MGVGSGWYYDSIDNDVVHQNLSESLANAVFTYYHGPYKTEAEAEAHKGVKGPEGHPGESISTQADNTVASAVGVNNFLGDLTSRNTFQRLAEGVIGVLLIVIGVAKLTENTAVGTALKKVPFV
jgi:hypothetical protein